MYCMKTRDCLGNRLGKVRWRGGLAIPGTIIAMVSLSGIAGSLSAADAQPHRTAQGFAYSHDVVADKPWSIHIVRIDRSRTDLELHTTVGAGNQLGMAVLSQQVKTVPPALGKPVAAINGDYYYNQRPYQGDPKGLQIIRGELVSGPIDWACFWVDATGGLHTTNVVSLFKVTWPNGEKTPIGLNEDRTRNSIVLYTPAIGSSTRTYGGREFILERDGTNTWLPVQAGHTYTARVREVRDGGDAPVTPDTTVLSLSQAGFAAADKVAPGTILHLSMATIPDLKGVQTAIGGGPALLRGGKAIEHDEAEVRHPRTAIGWNKTNIFLVQVDGRQRNLSVGMTYPELADYLIKLGCDEAMNLDGGGSASCWVYGQLMNSPSLGHERRMANALVLVRKDPKPSNGN
jgi:hypothetical protein